MREALKFTATGIPRPVLDPIQQRAISDNEADMSKTTQGQFAPSRVASQVPTAATTIVPGRFHEVSARSSVSTVKSISLSQDDELNFPLIPKATEDLEYICLYCFLVLSGDETMNSRRWKCVYSSRL
jgi:hypothetical protein